MARQVNKLSARTVQTLKEPGRYSDGQGLYLFVDENQAKRWRFHFQWRGKRREMGLGSALNVSLAEAREAAERCRKMVAQGVDPIAARTRQAGVPTLADFAESYIAEREAGWRGKNTASGWRRAFTLHAKAIGGIAVDRIDTEAVLKVLKPIWKTKAETAGKLRDRLEQVLDAAAVKGYRTGENPARWRGHLQHILPKRDKLTRGHMAAMPYAGVPAFMASLTAREGFSARALEWTILTASREDMTLSARWGDIQGEVWVIPAARMKSFKDHRVPLTPQCLAVLDLVRLHPKPDDFLFPGPKGKLSDAAMDKLMKGTGYTVHGFRSSFRDWAGDCTDHPREVAEAALAHAVGDDVERAYRRGDALEKRRLLMQAWADFTRPPDRPAAPEGSPQG
ncbi:tyrosine-type recombinase/integrase [Methylocaldum sp.]|uniref:tyrosine-type recombinase/integrase n=1 Tax=Methylocaldum sp. TaxID=1969727 RepID=UPI002D2769BC|nr:integrase arm-type DNA-binding domain-containing protein [Methylocaldum sp.]HYE38250.1 integrase arm-type DNA-binding domain-containing protein [Methylocaldum sp.]